VKKDGEMLKNERKKATLLRKFDANRARGEAVQLEIHQLQECLNAKKMYMKQVSEDRERLKNEQIGLANRFKGVTGQTSVSLDLARITRLDWDRTQYESLISELEEKIGKLDRKLERQRQLMRERIRRERGMPNGEGAQGPNIAVNGTGVRGTNGIPTDPRVYAAWEHIGATLGEDLVQPLATQQEDRALPELLDEEEVYEDAHENQTEHVILWDPCQVFSDETKDSPGGPKDDSAM